MSKIRTMPWPCSRVERDVSHSLWLESQRTGKPQTVIVAEAINAHLNAKLHNEIMPAIIGFRTAQAAQQPQSTA